MTDNDFFNLAVKASEKSYSPYSNFKVGAVLLTSDGQVFTGCNIENISYSLTMCAERTAFFKALADGVHKLSDFLPKRFKL